MKVAIVGDSQNTVADAPYDDPSWEIWGHNHGTWLRRCTRIFEIHDPRTKDMKEAYADPVYGAALRSVPRRFPSVIMYRHPDQPRSVWPEGDVRDFPFDDLIARYGRKRCLFTSTMAEMTAFALTFPDLEAIGFWGIDMDGRSEWDFQREGMAHYVGRAMERGIEVVIPEGSMLCDTPFIYGREDIPNQRMHERLDGVDKRIQGDLGLVQREEQVAAIGYMQMLVRQRETRHWKSRLPSDEFKSRMSYLVRQERKWQAKVDEAKTQTRDLSVKAEMSSWQRANWTIPRPQAEGETR